MARDYVGRAGDASTGMIIPVGQTQGTTGRIFPHILDAVSQIQQFYVIESSGQEIPDDFLTIRGKLNFFNVGFGAGFLEALLFALLTSLILPIISDQGTRHLLASYLPLLESDVFMWTLNLAPVIISAALCCYLSRCYIGKITKRAIDFLLLGRLFSLIIKGMILFFLLIFLSNQINTATAWTMADWLSFEDYGLATRIYQILLSMKPLLVQRAFEVIGIFGLAMILPFVTIWGVAWMRKVKTAKDKALMEK